MATDLSTHHARFRFYAGLNDLLAPSRRGCDIDYHFREFPGIKDPIEALGVPHTEVELIVVNGTSVDFSYRLRNGDQVAVYPPFQQLDIAPLKPLRSPLPHPTFVLDVHLGKLARLLRLLGLDALYDNAKDDAELVDITERENRVLLTRDRRLLFHRRIHHGLLIRSCNPIMQAGEVIARYRLDALIHPFSRCIACNGRVKPVDKCDILHRLEPKTKLYYDTFFRCEACDRIYWKGSHFTGLIDTLNRLQPFLEAGSC